MKSILALAAVAALASAQHLEGQPQCALPCLAQALTQVTSCAKEDTACQCRPEYQQQLVPIVAPCLLKSCTGPGELAQAQSAAAAVCAPFAAASSSAASAPAPAPSGTSSGGPPVNTPWTYPAVSQPLPTSSGEPGPGHLPTSSGEPGHGPLPTTSSESGSGPTYVPVPGPTITANHTSSSGVPHGTGTGVVPSGSVVPAAAAATAIPVLVGGMAAVMALAANL